MVRCIMSIKKTDEREIEIVRTFATSGITITEKLLEMFEKENLRNEDIKFEYKHKL